MGIPVKFGITSGCNNQEFIGRWIHNFDKTDISIVTVSDLNEKFDKFALEHKNKLIIHYIINMMGETNANLLGRDWLVQLRRVNDLIESGFPANQIYIRIDPIINERAFLEIRKSVIDIFGLDSYQSYLNALIGVCYSFGIRTFRLSYLIKANCEYSMHGYEVDKLDDWIREMKEDYPDCDINRFGESPFGHVNYCQKKDCKVIGINNPYITTVQLIEGPIECNHQCKYCYY